MVSGIRERNSTSMFAFINGMQIQARMAPAHQTQGCLPKARKKFSVHMAISRELQITRTLFLGGWQKETSRLPARLAAPVQAFTIPSAILLPPFLERIMAGSAALYMDAVKLMAARNRIRFRIPRFLFRYLRPSFAEASTDSSLFPSASACGIVINHASVMNAAENVIRSKASTASIPAKENTMVASTGVRTVTSELEKALKPDTRWYCSRGVRRLTATSDAGC